MAFTIVLGLAILSVVNYGNTFKFSGLDPAYQVRTEHKPSINPFSVPNNKPQLLDQLKSPSFNFKNVAAKPFGAPFDSFKPAYHQQYQPGTFKANYQPFGPYPGYPGPVIYSGQGSYPGPTAYPTPATYPSPAPYHQPATYIPPATYHQSAAFPSQPAYRFDGPDHNCGFQHFAPPPAAQPAFNPFKYGSTKKFNKNFPGHAEFNVPGKYFQEHQFGAYHNPEFFPAIITHEHHVKYSKPPKDFISNSPFIPYNKVESPFPSLPSGFPLPSFPKIEHVTNNVLPTKPELASDVSKGVEIIQSVTLDSSPATQQSPIDIIPGSQSHEGATVTDVAPNNDVPAADVGTSTQQKDDTKSDSVTELVPAQVSDSQPTTVAAEKSDSAFADEAKPISNADSTASPVSPSELPVALDESAVTNESPVSEDNVLPSQSPVSEDNVLPSQSPVSEDSVLPSQSPVSDNNVLPSQSPVSEDNVLPSQSPVSDENVFPSQSPVSEDNVFPSQTPVSEDVFPGQSPVSEDNVFPSQSPVSEENIFPSESPTEDRNNAPSESSVSNENVSVVLDDAIDLKFGAPKISDPSKSSVASKSENTVVKSEQVKNEAKPTDSVTANAPPSLPSGGPLFGPASDPNPSPSVFGSFGYPYFGGFQQQAPSYYPSSDAPVQFTEEELKKAYKEQFGMDLPQNGKFFTGGSLSPPLADSAEGPSAEKTEKTLAGQTSSAKAAEPPKKSGGGGAVQIIQDEPFRGQQHPLYNAPLNTFGFYSPSSLSVPLSHASQADYSAEQAFNNFGSQFRSGNYLVEGLPSAPGLTLQQQQSGQIPISISSPDHPLHSQVFKYSQSFVPYPQASSRSLSGDVPTPSSTAVPAAGDKTAAAATPSDAKV